MIDRAKRGESEHFGRSLLPTGRERSLLARTFSPALLANLLLDLCYCHSLSLPTYWETTYPYHSADESRHCRYLTLATLSMQPAPSNMPANYDAMYVLRLLSQNMWKPVIIH